MGVAFQVVNAALGTAGAVLLFYSILAYSDFQHHHLSTADNPDDGIQSLQDQYKLAGAALGDYEDETCGSSRLVALLIVLAAMGAWTVLTSLLGFSGVNERIRAAYKKKLRLALWVDIVGFLVFVPILPGHVSIDACWGFGMTRLGISLGIWSGVVLLQITCFVPCMHNTDKEEAVQRSSGQQDPEQGVASMSQSLLSDGQPVCGDSWDTPQDSSSDQPHHHHHHHHRDCRGHHQSRGYHHSGGNHSSGGPHDSGTHHDSGGGHHD